MTYTLSQAQAGRGSTVSIGATPTMIGELKNSPVTRGKWKFEDTTNFESASDSETLAVIRENGSVSLEGNRVSSDAGQVLAETAYQSGAIQAFVVQLPKTTGQVTNGDKYTFSAFVESSEFTVDVEKAISFKIGLKISGPCILVVGA